MVRTNLKKLIILIAVVIPLFCGITAFAVEEEITEIEILPKTPVTGMAGEVPVANVQTQAEDDVIKDIDELPKFLISKK